MQDILELAAKVGQVLQEKNLLLTTAEGIVPFTFVFLLKRLFSFMDLLIADGASTLTIFKMLFAIMPSVLLLSFPIAVLLSALMVYGRMASDREVLALYAAGYTVRQLLTPVLLLGVLLCGLMFWWSHRITPKGLRVFQSEVVKVLENTATAGVRPGIFNRLGDYVLYPSEVDSGDMKSLRIF